MSAQRKPVVSRTGTSTSASTLGTTRIPPLAGSRGGTPSLASRNAVASSSKVGPAKPAANGGGNDAPPPVVNTQRLLDKDRKMVEFWSPGDKCPVCASDRYLNPSLRLLVSKCYHKMCESCIDRIYTIGPGPCPVCGVILRKNQFKPQTYENLGVEKEVAIRTRIAKIFNKQEEDFPDLSTYNDYLEKVEIFTFNLINEVDAEETERQIAAYQRENAEQIDVSATYAEREAEHVRSRDEEERKQRQARAAEFVAIDEEDKRERERDEKDLIDKLEAQEGGSSSASAQKIINLHRSEAARRSAARLVAHENKPTNTSDSAPTLLSKYLGFSRHNKTQQERETDLFAPEDPCSDYDTLWYDYRDMFTLQNAYMDETTDQAMQGKDGERRSTGGFIPPISVWERCIRSAVMGLWTPPLRSNVMSTDGGESGDAVMSVA